MSHLLDHLSGIKATQCGGYRLTPSAEAFLTPYLAKHGFTLSQIQSHEVLVDILRQCNAVEFDALVAKPAPTRGLAVLWRAMRGLRR